MDIDEAEPTRNSPFIHYFDFNNFAWQEPRPEQIRLRRALLYDTLIFDILLNSGGIQDSCSLYPPTDGATLQELLDAIEGSSYDALKKDCLVYFLLKWHQDGREKHFAQQRCIPPQFSALADAYWHLDTGINIPKAVAILSDARLNRDYASKIIRAISLSPDPAPLIRKYVQTAKPPLVEPPDIETYMLALSESSLLEAWQYICTFHEGDEMHSRLLKKLFGHIVIPKPRPRALQQLLTLPLSPAQESVLHDFARKPLHDMPFAPVAVLQNLVCLKLVQSSRFLEAIKLDREFTALTPQKYTNDTRNRVRMVQDVYDALPAVERALINLELDPMSTKRVAPPPAKPPALPKPSSPKAADAMDTPLSQSWQDIDVPEGLVNKSTPLREIRSQHQQNSTPFSIPALSASTSKPPNPLIVPLVGGTPNGTASTPLKTQPLSTIISSTKPRTSLVGFGTRPLDTPKRNVNSAAIASPASGIKLPNPSSALNSSTLPSDSRPRTFISANKQQNAFYQPPAAQKPNNDITVAEGTNTEPNHVGDAVPFKTATTAALESQNLEMEVEEEHQEETTLDLGRKSPRNPTATVGAGAAEEEQPLEFSVFSRQAPAESRPVERVSSKRGAKRAPPGSLLSDEEQVEKVSRPARASRESKAANTSVESTRPPAKRSKQAKGQTRQLPGALIDEDDGEEEQDEDEVAPLRGPSPPSAPKRTVRKARASASVEMSDDFESGVQTRRRSSRRTITGSGSVQGSPEPPSAKALTRKSTRTTTSRKKRS